MSTTNTANETITTVTVNMNAGRPQKLIEALKAAQFKYDPDAQEWTYPGKLDPASYRADRDVLYWANDGGGEITEEEA